MQRHAIETRWKSFSMDKNEQTIANRVSKDCLIYNPFGPIRKTWGFRIIHHNYITSQGERWSFQVCPNPERESIATSHKERESFALFPQIPPSIYPIRLQATFLSNLFIPQHQASPFPSLPPCTTRCVGLSAA